MKLRKDRGIHDYSYKPNPIFYGGKMIIGIELEVNSSGYDDYNAKEV